MCIWVGDGLTASMDSTKQWDHPALGKKFLKRRKWSVNAPGSWGKSTKQKKPHRARISVGNGKKMIDYVTASSVWPAPNSPESCKELAVEVQWILRVEMWPQLKTQRRGLSPSHEIWVEKVTEMEDSSVLVQRADAEKLGKRHQWVCLRMLKYTCLCLRTAQTFRGCCLIDPISEASQGLNGTFLLIPMRKMGPFQPYRGPKEALKTETPPKAPWARGCPSLCSSS